MTTSDARRSISLDRDGAGRFAATNERGGRLTTGTGEDESFTPVELLLTAIAACSAVDVDVLTTRRSEPSVFSVECGGDKVRDADGNRMGAIDVTFTVTFPEGPEGDAARAVLPGAVQRSHDRLCTVSRTVELATPVTTTLTQ
ncbi:OsmC family protein [Demetria terragena]|uniref:OsmC family protein n=1 Tax=Demetria terragena TaxID=63959 RepID=UPI00036CB58B|nr:OsmC family protein [Demetria terragena]